MSEEAALGVLLDYMDKDTGPLFHGSAQYARFRQILSDLVAEHREDILRMGIDPDEIGVHSIRKGAATYCTSGTTTGISFVEYAEAGDRVCERTVTGLDVNSHEFSISPALLDVSAEEEQKVDSAKQLLFGPTPAKWGCSPAFCLHHFCSTGNGWTKQVVLIFSITHVSFSPMTCMMTWLKRQKLAIPGPPLLKSVRIFALTSNVYPRRLSWR